MTDLARLRCGEVRADLMEGAAIYGTLQTEGATGAYAKSESRPPASEKTGENAVVSVEEEKGRLERGTLAVRKLNDLPYRCEGCGARFAEYVNGCPHCYGRGLFFSVTAESPRPQAAQGSKV
jgi:hypothetical protein